MSAHRWNADLDDHLRVGFADCKDPGASGIIEVERKGYAICKVTTATAESRVLEDADNLPVGQLLLVILEVDAGDLTIDSDDADVVLDTAGDFALFVVVKSSATAQVWQIVSNTTMVDEVAAATTGLGGATLPADTSALTKLELSAKTDVDEIAAALIALTDALLAAGVIDTTLTQATK